MNTKIEDFYPYFLKDFHDQKDFFKTMHHTYAKSFKEMETFQMPNWMDAQVYCIDFFLFFLAHHGWTLQKCRKKNIQFKNIHETIENYKKIMTDLFLEELNKRKEAKDDSLGV